MRSEEESCLLTNWCLAGRARGQCVTVLSAIRSAPAAARNGTGQFSVLNDKFEFVAQIFTAPLPPAFMRGVPEGRGEYRTRMRKSFYLRRFALILG